MQKIPYLIAFLGWGLLLGLSACTPKPQGLRTVLLMQMRTFDGYASPAEVPAEPITDMCFDTDGNLYTLAQDSGQISVFDRQGRLLRAFADGRRGEKKFGKRAVAIGTVADKIIVVDAQNLTVEAWSRAGRLLQRAPLSSPLSAGDTVVAFSGDIIHNTEGFADSSLIVGFNARGELVQHYGELASSDSVTAEIQSVRQALARGDVPAFLKNSVLLATNRQGRIYALFRTEPLLQCYENGRLLFERRFDFPELASIREACRIRNYLLKAPSAFIPFSYWSDFTVDQEGSLYFLLAMQTHQTVYQLDASGKPTARLVGKYGKGHLVTVQNRHLAIANAVSHEVTIYDFPDLYDRG